MARPPRRLLGYLPPHSRARETLCGALPPQEWEVVVIEDVDDVIERLFEESWTCVVAAAHEGDRLETFLQDVDTATGPPLLVFVRPGDVRTAVKAMREGARDVLELDEDGAVPRTALREQLAQFIGLNLPPAQPADAFRRAADSPINAIIEIIPQIARSDAPVLISGESGTGKDLLARVIHQSGARASGPFVAVNCGAIPAGLLESELFGHVQGAFTGAMADKPGQFEAAHGGTLFLDEISDMPLPVQVKLLRVLQDKRIMRVGSTTAIPMDFRVIAATNRNLEESIEQGTFREDLYYRISVLPVHLPALRERPMDVPLLLEHFIEQQNLHQQTRIQGMTSEARSLLRRYAWPGNVRELENFVQRASVLKTHGYIERDDLPSHILKAPPTPLLGLDVPSEGIDMTETLDELENRLLRRALNKAQGNKARAARLLGINRTTLVEKLKRKHIEFQND